MQYMCWLGRDFEECNFVNVSFFSIFMFVRSFCFLFIVLLDLCCCMTVKRHYNHLLSGGTGGSSGFWF